MPPLDETPVLELGSMPIPGATACGIDAGDDEQYIAVGAEMAKVGRIEADEPEWYQIEQDATNLLSSKTKDFDIAASLGHALFKRYSYAGLSAAFGLLHEMVKNFWDEGFPARPRRRKARIEALASRFTDQAWFRDNQPKPDDFDALDACITRAEEVKAALTEKMPEDPPDFTKFIRGLKEHAGKRPKPAAAAATGGAEGGGPSAGAPAAQPTGEAFGAGEVADAGSAVRAILSACTFMRKADVTDPIPYAVARAIKWAKISLPTSDAAKFQITPPEASLVDTLTHQFSHGIWENLLKNAEAAFRSNDPLWLDLQRYTCAAMSNLGAQYDKARQAVMAVTAGLVNRLGESLFELTFRNGVALCGGDTKMWIEAEVCLAKSGPGGSGDAGNGKLSEASAKAKKLAGSGKLKEAVKELSDGLQTCTQRRERFLWRLRMAQLCYDAKRLQIAAPLLEECYDEVRRYHIDEWEPTLAVGVANTLYRCRKSLTSMEKNPAENSMQGVRESFAWLCQLDPMAALAAEPTGK